MEYNPRIVKKGILSKKYENKIKTLKKDWTKTYIPKLLDKWINYKTIFLLRNLDLSIL